LEEKRINNTVNVWMRAPFLVSAVVFGIVQLQIQENELDQVPHSGTNSNNNG
jgi:hypothetical protein